MSRSESESELRRIADNFNEQQSQDGIVDADLEYFNARNDQASLRHYRQRCDGRLPTDDKQQQQLRFTKRTNQRPASIKSAGSYDMRETGIATLRDTAARDTNSGGQHEHYMVPTHEPNRPSDKRTLSLFNPDFLPNFNDMLMYVGRSEIDAECEFYRSNIEEQPWDTNGPSIVECTQPSYDKTSCLRLDGSNDFSRNIDASYASLRLTERSSLQHLRDQDCENIYAPVGLQAFQSQGRIDYNC